MSGKERVRLRWRGVSNDGGGEIAAFRPPAAKPSLPPSRCRVPSRAYASLKSQSVVAHLGGLAAPTSANAAFCPTFRFHFQRSIRTGNARGGPAQGGGGGGGGGAAVGGTGVGGGDGAGRADMGQRQAACHGSCKRARGWLGFGAEEGRVLNADLFVETWILSGHFGDRL